MTVAQRETMYFADEESDPKKILSWACEQCFDEAGRSIEKTAIEYTGEIFELEAEGDGMRVLATTKKPADGYWPVIVWIIGESDMINV